MHACMHTYILYCVPSGNLFHCYGTWSIYFDDLPFCFMMVFDIFVKLPAGIWFCTCTLHMCILNHIYTHLYVYVYIYIFIYLHMYTCVHVHMLYPVNIYEISPNSVSWDKMNNMGWIDASRSESIIPN